MFLRDMQSEDISALAEALVEFQYQLESAKKDSKNPFFKSTYADLEACQEALREPLHANGLAVSQTTRVTDSGATLITTLMHKSGQWIKGELPLSATKANDPQAQGSAITYARRYALSAITGLTQTDDDAEAAMQRDNKKPAHKPLGLDPEQIEQLIKAGEGNGWKHQDVTAFVCDTFKLQPDQLKEKLTQKQWEWTIKVLLRPENAGGTVTHSGDGKPLAPEHHWSAFDPKHGSSSQNGSSKPESSQAPGGSIDNPKSVGSAKQLTPVGSGSTTPSTAKQGT